MNCAYPRGMAPTERLAEESRASGLTRWGHEDCLCRSTDPLPTELHDRVARLRVFESRCPLWPVGDRLERSGAPACDLHSPRPDQECLDCGIQERFPPLLPQTQDRLGFRWIPDFSQRQSDAGAGHPRLLPDRFQGSIAGCETSEASPHCGTEKHCVAVDGGRMRRSAGRLGRQ